MIATARKILPFLAGRPFNTWFFELQMRKPLESPA